MELASHYGCYDPVGDTVYMVQPSTSTGIEVLTGADAGSFQELSEANICFAKDKNHVYLYDQVLPWADPKTFAVLANFRGSILLLANEDEIISWSNNDLSTPGANCLPGPNGAGKFCTLPNGDANTFQLIDSDLDITPWAKDKNNVYCGASLIPHADPSTAQVSNGIYLRVTVDGISRIYGGEYGCIGTSSSASMRY